MKTISFNTGRRYTSKGQFVVATLHEDGVVTFFDHSRSVDGEFLLCGDRFDQEVVMHAYDRYIAKGTARSWADGMLSGGCNTRRSS